MVSLNATVFSITLNVNDLTFFKFAFLSIPSNHSFLHVAHWILWWQSELLFIHQWMQTPALYQCRILIQSLSEFSCSFSRSRRIFLISVQPLKAYFPSLPLLQPSFALKWGRMTHRRVFCLSCSGSWSPPCTNAGVLGMKEKRKYIYDMEGIK